MPVERRKWWINKENGDIEKKNQMQQAANKSKNTYSPTPINRPNLDKRKKMSIKFG